MELDDQRYDICAQVHIMCGYLAHADQSVLLNFATRLKRWPSEAQVAHGNTRTKLGLADALWERYVQQSREVGIMLSGIDEEERVA